MSPPGSSNRSFLSTSRVSRLTTMRKGVPISPGIAVARAFRIDQAFARPSNGPLEAKDIDSEIGRFDEACNSVAVELDQLIQRVSNEVGEDAAAIFRSHRVLLRDPAMAE